MPLTVSIDGLEDAVKGILSDFSRGVDDGVEIAVSKAAKAVRKTVKARSPRRTGGYAKEWKIQMNPTGIMGKVTSATIYNEKYYFLTHLLENGHQKTDGGRVAGIPHISVGEAEAEKLLPQLITQEIEEAVR